MRKWINWFRCKFQRKEQKRQIPIISKECFILNKFDYTGIQKIAKDYIEPIKKDKKREDKKELVYFTELAVLVDIEKNEKLHKLDLSRIDCNFKTEKEFDIFEKYLLGLYGYSYDQYRIDFEIQSKYV